ncbi:hypothetical protein AVEN_195713-1 [Araneus ventricosus]|uniref:DNA helicase Pif1-like 2B domain-containing protein n=1 Tax=Araneus ventricosus TaxID=182803 RepID=A0A4Y2RKM8_ARAVE|nr:hypothetical protein AVEN_195713-1 [Araneus ventricosus]
MNKQLLQEFTGSVQVYKSVDATCDTNEAANYPAEFLNTLETSGVPSHTLELKVGAPIMLLRNLHPPSLYNGTRLCIKKLMPNIIEATIMTGHAAGEDVFIPIIPIIPSDFPFQFKRIQFPVHLSFTMSINKAQGHSLKDVGLDLNLKTNFPSLIFSGSENRHDNKHATGNAVWVLIVNYKLKKWKVIKIEKNSTL